MAVCFKSLLCGALFPGLFCAGMESRLLRETPSYETAAYITQQAWDRLAPSLTGSTLFDQYSHAFEARKLEPDVSILDWINFGDRVMKAAHIAMGELKRARDDSKQVALEAEASQFRSLEHKIKKAMLASLRHTEGAQELLRRYILCFCVHHDPLEIEPAVWAGYGRQILIAASLLKRAASRDMGEGPASKADSLFLTQLYKAIREIE